MARVSRALPHLSAAEVQEKIRTAHNARRQQKWLIIYNALVEPRTAAEIAKHTGTSIRTVHQVISDYNRLGVEAIETPGSGGRRHSYLNLEEEQRLLEELKPKAKRGEITSKMQVKQAFEQKVEHKVHKTTIYRLLERHQWRKLKPQHKTCLNLSGRFLRSLDTHKYASFDGLTNLSKFIGPPPSSS